jgi:hypothetical protein
MASLEMRSGFRIKGSSERRNDMANTGEIGTAHGIHHHLLGEQLNTYEVTFFQTLDALIDDKD